MPHEDSIESKHSKNMTDGDAWLSRLDTPDRLDVNAELRSSGCLAFSCPKASSLGRRTQICDPANGFLGDVRGNAFSLCHAEIFTE
jgi:hypothetical protein